jgi:hypothetical protein
MDLLFQRLRMGRYILNLIYTGGKMLKFKKNREDANG